jgi:rhamnogalacturonyl hydrolase YesR
MSDLPYVNTWETEGVPPDKNKVRELTLSMADRIINDTSFSFIDAASGKVYHDSEQLPVNENIRLKSGYNDWKYWNGVIHMAFLKLSDIFNIMNYRYYVIDNYTFAFKHLDYFKKLFDAKIPMASFHQFFRLDRLDDFGALSSALLDLHEIRDKKDLRHYLEKVKSYIKITQDRLDDTTFARNRFDYTTLWGDDMFMSIPFLVRAAKVFNDDEMIEDAVNQVFNFDRHLRNPNNGLYYHCKYVNLGQHGVAHWGRANGWMVLAQCELLDHLPEKHAKRPALINILQNHLIALSRHQAANGMWHQLIDKNDSFHESSSTAMFTYGFARAINQGWLDNIYSQVAIAGWNGLSNNITSEGILKNVSMGFNIKQELPFYYRQPVEEFGEHGVGAALMAGAEMYRMTNFRDCVWC